MQKQIIFFVGSKGGSGKSVLYFLVAEKYIAAMCLDQDDATKTTMTQLRYRNPRLISFQNKDNMIDRGFLDVFFEKISSGKSEKYLCDMGGAISQQLPFYFQDVIDFLPKVLIELKIDLQLYCVVAGANLFTSSMQYLIELQKSLESAITIKVFKNEFHTFNEEQSATLSAFCNDHNLTLIPFTISSSKARCTQDRITEVLKAGDGIEGASPITKEYFLKAIKNLPV
jgi:hypothetical protein